MEGGREERERARERERDREREREKETEREMKKDTLKSSAEHHDLGLACRPPNRLTLTCIRHSLIICHHWMMLCIHNHGVKMLASVCERVRAREREVALS